MGPAQSGYSLEARLAGIDHPSHNEASAEPIILLRIQAIDDDGQGSWIACGNALFRVVHDALRDDAICVHEIITRIRRWRFLRVPQPTSSGHVYPFRPASDCQPIVGGENAQTIKNLRGVPTR
jgi:hypothetical protein